MNHEQKLMYDQTPALHHIIEELSSNTNMPTPHLHILPCPQRYPERGVITVTRGPAELLEERVRRLLRAAA